MTQTITNAPNQTSQCFEIKGGLYTLTALQLYDFDETQFHLALTNKISEAPKFFLGAPMIIDMTNCRSEITPERFDQLLSMMREHGLRPVGVKTDDTVITEAVGKHHLAVFPKRTAGTDTTTNTPNKTKTAKKDEALPTATKLITQPVRSGQQIYAKGGDLLVLAPVSAGAELLADGHIHVHGALRGRALAGVTGYESARIFCHSLEAELVSIAGHYRLCDDLKESHWKQAATIQLVDEKLEITS